MARPIKYIDPKVFFKQLFWIDGRPLLKTMESYRLRDLRTALYSFNPDGSRRYSLALIGRGKKNFKSTDLILAALHECCSPPVPQGNRCLIYANDEGQAAEDLSLAKLLWKVNPLLRRMLRVKQDKIVRRDNRGSIEILPANSPGGEHGKTYRGVFRDELQGLRDYSLIEASSPDPTRADAFTWITSYQCLGGRPGIPLYDYFERAKKGTDPRLYFSWYSSTFTTDPDFQNLPPEERANPSMRSWQNPFYLEEEKGRLPAHRYRRLHLNEGGGAEGCFLDAGKILDAVATGIHVRPPLPGIEYRAFFDGCGGTSDSQVLAIGHDDDGIAIIDCIVNQGTKAPFDPIKALDKLFPVLREYRVTSIVGDAYAGQIFARRFQEAGFGYRVSELSKHQLYEAFEPRLNSGRVILLDDEVTTSELIGLVWRGKKIDHASAEHDDHGNSVAGLTFILLDTGPAQEVWSGGEAFCNPARLHEEMVFHDGGSTVPIAARWLQ